MNPAAKDRAAYYASEYGSARAALSAVEQPGYNDAFERAVCDELRSLSCAEARIANAGKSWIDMFRLGQAEQDAKDAAWQAERAAFAAQADRKAA